MFTELSDFISEVLSSSAMPGLFQYQNFAGSTYIDGGT
jgi:predicted patatin/cPLA2 family phospholipase